jgi:hypothetical protein
MLLPPQQAPWAQVGRSAAEERCQKRGGCPRHQGPASFR